MSDYLKFKAKIIREIYYNEENNFGIYSFITEDEIPYHASIDIYDVKFSGSTATLKGQMQRLVEDVEYNVVAELIIDKKYGKQYKVINMSKDAPKTIDDSRSFLCAITSNERVIDNLLEAYPNIINDIINDNDYIPDLKGIKWVGESTYKMLRKKIIDNYCMSDILVLLRPLGVTMTMVKNIMGVETNTSLLKQKLIDNPYVLVGKVPRLTFEKVDNIALGLNPSLKNSQARLYAAITSKLIKLCEDSGDTIVPIANLTSEIKKIFIDNYSMYEDALKDEKDNPKILKIVNDKIGLMSYYKIEKYVWEKLNKINQSDNIYNIDLEKILNGIDKRIGYSLSDEQAIAVKSIKDNNVIIISGKAGSGKSTVLKAVLDVYGKYKINIVAFSAKAARRTEEVTGVPAQTIHKFLGAQGDGTFKFNEDNLVKTDMVIIDEMSMVNTNLFYHLLKALPETCKLVLVGDNRQLPAIGCGAVYSDLLKLNNNFSKHQLSKVFRQAEDSGIISDANKIRDGVKPFKKIEATMVRGINKDMFYIANENSQWLQNTIVDSYIKFLNKGYTTEEVQIVVPRRSACTLSTAEINLKILNKLLPPEENQSIEFGNKVFRKGCRIINTQNDYQKIDINDKIVGILNGETGTVIDFKDERDEEGKKIGQLMIVDFGNKIISFNRQELIDIELAYALTVHKTQGSQYKIIIIGLENAHYIMLNRQLLYTAITRAKEKCVVVTSPIAFDMCCKKDEEANRITFWRACDFPHTIKVI